MRNKNIVKTTILACAILGTSSYAATNLHALAVNESHVVANHRYVLNEDKSLLTKAFDTNIDYARQFLTNDGKKAYDYIVSKLLTYENEGNKLPKDKDGNVLYNINLSSLNVKIDRSEFTWIRKAVTADDPRMYFIVQGDFKDGDDTVKTNANGEVTSWDAQVRFHKNGHKYIDALKEMETSVTGILGKLSNEVNSYQVEEKIRTEFEKTVKYNLDYEKVFDPGVMYSMLNHEHQGACGGYSWAFEYLLKRAGFNVTVMAGWADQTNRTLGHAWNNVLIDGKWYVADATWDWAPKSALDPAYTVRSLFSFFNAFKENPTLSKDLPSIWKTANDISKSNPTLLGQYKVYYETLVSNAKLFANWLKINGTSEQKLSASNLLAKVSSHEVNSFNNLIEFAHNNIRSIPVNFATPVRIFNDYFNIKQNIISNLESQGKLAQLNDMVHYYDQHGNFNGFDNNEVKAVTTPVQSVQTPKFVAPTPLALRNNNVDKINHELELSKATLVTLNTQVSNLEKQVNVENGKYDALWTPLYNDSLPIINYVKYYGSLDDQREITKLNAALSNAKTSDDIIDAKYNLITFAGKNINILPTNFSNIVTTYNNAMIALNNQSKNIDKAQAGVKGAKYDSAWEVYYQRALSVLVEIAKTATSVQSNEIVKLLNDLQANRNDENKLSATKAALCLFVTKNITSVERDISSVISEFRNSAIEVSKLGEELNNK